MSGLVGPSGGETGGGGAAAPSGPAKPKLGRTVWRENSGPAGGFGPKGKVKALLFFLLREFERSTWSFPFMKKSWEEIKERI